MPLFSTLKRKVTASQSHCHGDAIARGDVLLFVAVKNRPPFAVRKRFSLRTVHKMSAMNYLMMYGTDESSSGETSDEEKETVDQTAGTATGSSTANEEICQAEENTIKARASLSEISGNDSLDSDGSFFDAKEFPDRTSKKRTKKQIQKEDSEKRRRRSHALKAENCNCRFECVNKIGKDDRIQIHGRFWNLDVSGQAAFIRETVQLAPFTRRVKNQFIAEEPKKRKKYVFHLMADKIEPVKVCRKFYMNTIGFSENCG